MHRGRLWIGVDCGWGWAVGRDGLYVGVECSRGRLCSYLKIKDDTGVY